jgi:hypothetical protein
VDEKREKREYKEAAKRERLAEESRLQFIRASLKFPEGRDFFYWLLSITGLNANCFSTNALTTAFNCGQTNIGQIIQGKMIEADPDLYLMMLKEQENARRAQAGPAADNNDDDLIDGRENNPYN